MTKDELDEWMYQRGFRPLETLRSPKAPRRVSPEEAAKIRLWLKKRWEVLARVILEVRIGKITIEEGRRRLNETRERLAEEFGMGPGKRTPPRDAPRVLDVNPATGIGADNATGVQSEGHRPEDCEATDPGVVH